MTKAEAAKINIEGLFEHLGSSEYGLSNAQAQEKLQKFGKNILENKGTSALSIFVRQFKNSLIFLLMVATILSFAVQDFTDGLIILVILIINTVLGFFQEYRSEKIVEKLEQLIPKTAVVRRSGKFSIVDQPQLVVGDVVLLKAGDVVPADLRLIEATDLEVNESQLSGESNSVVKGFNLSKKDPFQNLMFTGSTVEKGEGLGVVYAVANQTEFGKIAALSTQTKRITPYEKSLQSFSTFLIRAVLSGLAVLFVFKLFSVHQVGNISELFLFLIALAVAVVPEALPVIATLTLSAGALKLAKQHVVVKRLSSLEDLGNVNVLCTDKTGTITENKMTVKAISSENSELFQKFAAATIITLKGKKHRPQNTYDDAFIKYVPEKIQKEAKHLLIVKELPFNPVERRRLVVLADNANEKHYLVAIGAPEAMFKISGAAHHEKYEKEIHQQGQSGLHHLAIAYKVIEYEHDFEIEKHAQSLKFLGFASFIDPLRPTTKHTVQLAMQLGIQIKILTGDSKDVAEYVGAQIGLLKPKDKVYCGNELEKMDQLQFKKAVISANIFARVTPQQKFAIIEILKEKNIIAYQGDGINDAPALKLADVGIAVSNASDIAKENSDIILLNKSLEVIINGIRYGRVIFVNINKYITYTMIGNFGNFIALSALYLVSTILPILPLQVLLTSLITDLPLISIYSDNVGDEEVIQPEKHNTRSLLLISLLLGLPTAIFEVGYYAVIRSMPLGLVQTSLYVFLTIIGLILFFAVRNRDYFWRAVRPSKILCWSFIIALIFSIGVVYIQPFKKLFMFTALPPQALLMIFGISIIFFLILDFIKVRYYQIVSKENTA